MGDEKQPPQSPLRPPVPKSAVDAQGDTAHTDVLNNNSSINIEKDCGEARVKRVNCSSPRAPLVSPDEDCESDEEEEDFLTPRAHFDEQNDTEGFPSSCNILDEEDTSSKRQFPVPNVADFEVKILVIGATNSGKTSLIEKYLTGSNSRARTTLCLDINKARIPFEFMGETYHLTFYIYDMAGMKKFQSHNSSSSYYADVFAVLFVFDITCRISLNFTINWLGDYCNFCKKQQFSPAEKILVCNKCDLPNAIMTREELMNFAQVSGMTSLFECSAKSGRNVDSLFSYIAQQFMIEKTSKLIPPDIEKSNRDTPQSSCANGS